ncbi:MAG: Hsp20/alpha crystallin family protein [Planctomycetota bacterium]
MSRIFFPNARFARAFNELASDVENVVERMFESDTTCNDADGEHHGGCKTSQAETDATIRMEIDVLETDDAFSVIGDLPGVDPQSINVEVDEDRLVISALRKRRSASHDGASSTHEDDNLPNVDSDSTETHQNESVDPTASTTWHRRERLHGTYRRTVSLPKTVDKDAIQANFESGVLTVSLPKRPEPQPRKVHVEVK